MAQHGFNHFGSANAGNIDPNDLAMAGGYSASFSTTNNFNTGSGNAPNGFSSGSAVFGDDELLDGLVSASEGQSNMHGHGHGQDYGVNMAFSQGPFQSHRGGSSLHVDPSHINGYSHTPDGDPIQSPYATGFGGQFRQMQNHSLATSLHSPLSYSGSPLAGNEMNADGGDPAYLNAKARARMSAQQMQRKASNTRTPMTPKTNGIHGLPIVSQDSPGFGAQPVRGSASHEKSPSGQWMNTPTGSIPASYNSGFSSPMQQGMVPINEVILKGGTSMPAKLGVAPNAVSTQEMKRKRRRESHNLVERRRRDNINERIQDLSKLVPTHRLEDDKVRKLIQNGTPLSPTLTGISSPSQATSGLAGPGARRAASVNTGNITTGLPIEDKDKGPNKGDILNGAVSWTRDLMWMLHLKLQQQEELMNIIAELGGHFPFELTEDEKRMQTELMDAISKNDTGTFSYSRAAGSGLRVPNHTDYRGDPVGSLAANLSATGITPEDSGNVVISGDLGDSARYWNDMDDDGSGHAAIHFKEEDEYDMDLTH
ncbi:bHLH family transcription factor [Drechmeria coniospora]|uniref:BHLH family transcription factor n=1 Tax=Drechmeria coniospora TaxID=98403 RepID=A0A151GFZ0_DRECN|nr:bHLH family transcription factor [Drechmeria coniospora]KYK55982.1 bHLH family transcription factor [Drechmeria coniospora]